MSVTNSVNLIGRIAVAPTLRTVEGVDYVDTRIAVDLGYKTKDGERATTFAPITISRPVPKQGESNQARRFLDWADKGALVAVEGEFRQGNKFVGKDGSDRYGEHYIRVNNFQILETKASAEARRAQAAKAAAQAPVQEAPVEAPAPAEVPAPVQEAPVEAPVEDTANFQDLAEQAPVMTSNPLELSEDDLPF